MMKETQWLGVMFFTTTFRIDLLGNEEAPGLSMAMCDAFAEVEKWKRQVVEVSEIEADGVSVLEVSSEDQLILFRVAICPECRCLKKAHRRMCPEDEAVQLLVINAADYIHDQLVSSKTLKAELMSTDTDMEVLVPELSLDPHSPFSR